MLPRGSLLDSLPNELLGMIKACYDEYDLVGHVNFCQLTPRTIAFYPDDGFWERLCRMNGLGYLDNSEQRDDPLHWFQIASECALHVLECTHPQCGSARLAENARMLAKCAKRIRGFDYFRTLTATGKDLRIDAWSSTIFEHIAFRKDTNSFKPQCVAYLRPVDNEKPPKESITAHPIALRSFATFPPVTTMMGASPFMSSEDPKDENGVTVAQILGAMYKPLSEALPADELVELMEGVDGEVFPDAWSSIDRLSAIKEVKDWFNIVKWKGFVPEESGEGYRFHLLKFVASPATLPESYDALLATLEYDSDD